MPMPRSALLFPLLALLALPACGENGPPQDLNPEPFRDQWRVEFEGDFPYLGPEDMPQITSIAIGGRGGDNFANRGDVIVDFSGPEGKIKIEFRRFTFANDEEAAQIDFEKLHPWVYNTSLSSPEQPSEMNPDNDCTTGWLDGCGIRVWYEGTIQRASTGADIRVTLPPSYRHAISIVTEDNVDHGDDAYLDRGNICIKGLGGSAPDVQLENGEVFVTTRDDLVPGPSCSAADIEACQTWEEDGMDAAWSQNCPCTEFGTISASTFNRSAANMTADIPSDLWTFLALRNELADGSGSIPANDPDHCVAEVSIDGVEVDEATADQPHVLRGELNHPSDAAIVGGGYSVSLNSEACLPVAFTENPSEYAMGEEPQSEEVRGHLEVCDGCLEDQTCEQLLDGL